MDEICDSMLIAARIGMQVGRDMQVDQVINSWKQHADTLEEQRNTALRQIETQNALIEEYRQKERNLVAIVAELKKKNSNLIDDSKQLIYAKNTYKVQLAVQSKQLEKALASSKATEKIAKELQEKIESQKKFAKEQRISLEEQCRLDSARLRATWARLVGAERVIGRLISEIIDNAPNIKLEMLDEDKRKSVLLKAWMEVAESKARYQPCLRFTFTSLPI